MCFPHCQWTRRQLVSLNSIIQASRADQHCGISLIVPLPLLSVRCYCQTVASNVLMNLYVPPSRHTLSLPSSTVVRTCNFSVRESSRESNPVGAMLDSLCCRAGACRAAVGMLITQCLEGPNGPWKHNSGHIKLHSHIFFQLWLKVHSLGIHPGRSSLLTCLQAPRVQGK